MEFLYVRSCLPSDVRPQLTLDGRKQVLRMRQVLPPLVQQRARQRRVPLRLRDGVQEEGVVLN